jgi:hypothetical protein
MTNAEFKTATKDEQIKFLSPLVKIGVGMLMAGTLKKNVVRFFLNKGIKQGAADNLVALAEIEAEELSHYKFK